MTKIPNRVHRTFTWTEWCDLAAKRGQGNLIRDRKLDAGWSGASHADALERARGAGYQEVLPEVETLVAQIDQQVDAELHQTTFASTFDVAGAEVDLGRFLAGEPECMIESTPIRIARQGRAVRIVVPVSVSSNVPAEKIRQRGAAVMALCDVLARAQHPLEVWASVTVRDQASKGRCAHVALVQAANEPLDAGRLLYAIAHPSMLRQLGFAVMEHESEADRDRFSFRDPGAFGWPVPADATDLPDQHGATIVLPMLTDAHGWSVDESVAWIVAQLECIFGGGD